MPLYPLELVGYSMAVVIIWSLAGVAAMAALYKKVRITLRRFAFDKHLREECRALVSLLQFCARDLAESQGVDMILKLSVLAEIQAAIEVADRV